MQPAAVDRGRSRSTSRPRPSSRCRSWPNSPSRTAAPDRAGDRRDRQLLADRGGVAGRRQAGLAQPCPLRRSLQLAQPAVARPAPPQHRRRDRRGLLRTPAGLHQRRPAPLGDHGLRPATSGPARPAGAQPAADPLRRLPHRRRRDRRSVARRPDRAGAGDGLDRSGQPVRHPAGADLGGRRVRRRCTRCRTARSWRCRWSTRSSAGSPSSGCAGMPIRPSPTCAWRSAACVTRPHRSAAGTSAPRSARATSATRRATTCCRRSRRGWACRPGAMPACGRTAR